MKMKSQKKNIMENSIVFIPSEYKDTYLNLCACSVPTLIMTRIGGTGSDCGDWNCCLDRKCPCECSDRYQHFKLRKNDLDDWIRFHPDFYRIN